MKYLVVILLTGFAAIFCSQAATATVLKTHLTDDGSLLSIRIMGNQNGRVIHYDRQFDIRNRSVWQKEMIVYRAYASVDLFPSLNQLPWLVGTVAVIMVGLAVISLLIYRDRRMPHLQM